MIELIGLVERENRIGPRTEPWGTPYWNAAGCKSVLPTLTECVLPDRYDLNQPSASSLIP